MKTIIPQWNHILAHSSHCFIANSQQTNSVFPRFYCWTLIWLGTPWRTTNIWLLDFLCRLQRKKTFIGKASWSATQETRQCFFRKSVWVKGYRIRAVNSSRLSDHYRGANHFTAAKTCIFNVITANNYVAIGIHRLVSPQTGVRSPLMSFINCPTSGYKHICPAHH